MMVRREPYECLSTSERRAFARNLGGNAEIQSVPFKGTDFLFSINQPCDCFHSSHYILEVSLWNK